MMKGINIDTNASFKILDWFVELGGNFIDTANGYSNGESEEIIGEWMKAWVQTVAIDLPDTLPMFQTWIAFILSVPTLCQVTLWNLTLQFPNALKSMSGLAPWSSETC